MTSRLNTLWIGPSLGPLERACLRSALRMGHAVALYCYSEPAGVPEGVEVVDAEPVVPESRVVRHSGGSPSLFSNLFRFELQRRSAGPWIDADMYFVAPVETASEYVFGWQQPGVVNNAVLQLPADAPILEPLLRLFDEADVPFWLPRRERRAARTRLRATGRTGLAHMPWGSAGPHAMTALVRRHGLEAWALPSYVFYPVPYERAGWITQPGVRLEDVVQPGTVGVHLWNELIKGYKDVEPPADTFLARLHEEGA
jgi:hypothetical protein